MQSRYAYPAGAYFCMRKSRQNALGAVPQDPLTLKLRLDTNDVNIVRTAPQIRSQGACGAFLCEVSASQSQKVTLPRLWVKQAVTCPDGPFPAAGEGNGGAEPSAASGGCSEAEHPQRSKKSSKRAARRFFRAPQGGRDCDWPRRGPGGSRTRRFSRLTARPFLTIMELENIPRKEC